MQRERPGADMAPRIAALLADTPGQGIDTLRWKRARVTMAGTKFSKLLSAVTFYSKYTRALTFENLRASTMADLQKTVRAAWPDVASLDARADVSKEEAKLLEDRQAAAVFGSLVPGVYIFASIYLCGQGEGECAIER